MFAGLLTGLSRGLHKWFALSAICRRFGVGADKTQTGQNAKEEQQNRERREIRRAAERAQNQHAHLKAIGKESKTSYGHALFQNYAELFSQGINLFLVKKLDNPTSAGPHHQAWEFLLHFCNQGPRPIAVIVMTCVIDRISTLHEKKKLARVIGRALQDELNGTVVHEAKGTALLALVKKKLGRKTVSEQVMRKLSLTPRSWTNEEKCELGCLCLDILAASTHLIEQQTKGKQLLIKATSEVEELIRNQPPRAMPIRRLPSLVPLEPWEDVRRNGKLLATSRKPMDLSHITKESAGYQIKVVNGLEAQAMHIPPEMARLQRDAWDAGLPVFPVQRDPNRQELYSVEDSRKRARIEEALLQAEEINGRPFWLDHDMDFRGRVYTGARLLSYQSPEHVKGLVEFYRGEACGEEGFEQMLMAAAGHFGLSKQTWDERLDWGKRNLHLLSAVAQHPLDRIDLWKEADDPWQFMQMAMAINDWLMNPGKKMHVPVRFDQTCSGMGIIACLTRDRKLARLTNCIGDSREDLYAEVAGDLTNILHRDLEGFDFRSARMAEIWLKHQVTREVTKGPTLTTIYGARYFGIVEQLTDFLIEKKPAVTLEDWDREYTWPAQYLANKLNVVIANRLKSCVAVETWLRGVSKACLKRQQRIRYTTPMGFPIALGVEQEARRKVATTINGSKRWETTDTVVIPGELSARATNRGITANVIHSFDGSFCSAVVGRMHATGREVMCNHDCWAALPSAASQLHNTCLQELREHYKPDWLVEMREEISENAGIDLPMPPNVGDLCEGEIGNNPYCFS